MSAPNSLVCLLRWTNQDKDIRNQTRDIVRSARNAVRFLDIHVAS